MLFTTAAPAQQVAAISPAAPAERTYMVFFQTGKSALAPEGRVEHGLDEIGSGTDQTRLNLAARAAGAGGDQWTLRDSDISGFRPLLCSPLRTHTTRGTAVGGVAIRRTLAGNHIGGLP